MSLLFDSQYGCEVSSSPSSHSIPQVSSLMDTIKKFKDTLNVTLERSREIERGTREQRNSQLWFSVRRYRITSSLFGAVFT